MEYLKIQILQWNLLKNIQISLGIGNIYQEIQILQEQIETLKEKVENSTTNYNKIESHEYSSFSNVLMLCLLVLIWSKSKTALFGLKIR